MRTHDSLGSTGKCLIEQKIQQAELMPCGFGRKAKFVAEVVGALHGGEQGALLMRHSTRVPASAVPGSLH